MFIFVFPKILEIKLLSFFICLEQKRNEMYKGSQYQASETHQKELSVHIKLLPIESGTASP